MEPMEKELVKPNRHAWNGMELVRGGNFWYTRDNTGIDSYRLNIVECFLYCRAVMENL